MTEMTVVEFASLGWYEAVLRYIDSNVCDEVYFREKDSKKDMSVHQLFQVLEDLLLLKEKDDRGVVFKETLQLLTSHPGDEKNLEALDYRIHYLSKLKAKAHENGSLYADVIMKALAPYIDEGIQKAIETQDFSLTETLILALGEGANRYQELIDIALSQAKSDKQMQRVLYNTLREIRRDVRGFVGDGIAWW